MCLRTSWNITGSQTELLTSVNVSASFGRLTFPPAGRRTDLIACQVFANCGIFIELYMITSNFKYMKTNNLLFMDKAIKIVLFLLLTIIFAQCTKTDKDDYIPAVYYTHSAIYDINSSEWTGDSNGYNLNINVPEITEDIYYNGAVLVYRLVETAPKSFNMLPYTYMDNLLTVYMDFDVYVGIINLMYKEVYNSANDTPVPGNMSFKVVIIKGIPLGALKGIVDVNNYEAVARMLNTYKPLRKTVQF
jgi:hypothetical protein